jgi:NAD(P)-dependent dehydrogenase (short-subunit alcohol dehydrogenase family)
VIRFPPMAGGDDFDIAGCRVLVTGSSRGLGEGIAMYLAGQGARVAVHGRDEERLEAVKERVAAAGGEVVSVRGDARDPDAARSFVQAAADGLDGLDAVINNAGGTFAAPASELSPGGFAAVVATNLTGPFNVARFAFPHLEKAHGCVINIGTAAALRPSPTFSHYAAAKAGLVSLTRTLAAEWGERGVRANAVLPGLLGTEAALESLFANDPERIREAERKIGVGRLGRTEDVAMACRYLLSSAASFVNGEVLVVDGGPPNIPSF